VVVYSTAPKFIETFKANAKTPEAIDALPPHFVKGLGFGDHTIEQIVLGDVEFLRNSLEQSFDFQRHDDFWMCP
jgi:hypothetical protein